MGRHRKVVGRSASAGAVSFFAIRCFSAVSGAVVLVMMSRTLGADDFGVFSIALTMCMIGASISDGGLNSLLTRETIQRPELELSLVKHALVLRFIAGVGVAIALVGVSFFLAPATAQFLPMVLVILTLPILAVSVLVNVLSRRLRLARVAMLTAFQSVIWISLVSILSSIDASLVMFAGAYFVSSGLYAVVAIFASWGSLPNSGVVLSINQAWKILNSAIPLGVSSVMTSLYAKLGGLVVFILLGAAANGQYAIAYRLIDQLSLIPMTVAMVFSPMFNLAIRENGDLRSIVAQWVRVTLGTSVLVGASAAASADWIITFAFGREYSDAVLPFQVLCGAFVLICLGWVLTPLAIAFRDVRAQLIITCMGLLVSFLTALILINASGLLGAALATLLTEAIVVLGLCVLAVRRLGRVKINWLEVFGLVMCTFCICVSAIYLPIGVSLLLGPILGCIILVSTRVLRIDDLKTRVPAGLA